MVESPDRRAQLRRAEGRDWVAIILAIGLATGVNLITAAVMYDAVRSDTPGLSENATQILTTAFGGIVGVLGGYIGGRAVERAQQASRENATEDALSAPSRRGTPTAADTPLDP